MSTIAIETPSAPEPCLAGLAVLLVEDDPDTVDAVSAMLEAAGARVTHASSASAALDALKRRFHDVVLTDYALGGATGYHLLRLVRAEPVDGHVPIVCYSAYDDMVPVEERQAFTAYVPKPAVLFDLVRTVRGALG